MKLLKRDTAAEIKKTADASAAASAKLLSLRNERNKVVVDGDFEAVVTVDTEIAKEEARVAVLQEKLRLLDKRQKEERHADRVSAKEKAFKAFAEAYREKRVAPAQRLIELFAQAGDAYAEYRASRDLPFKEKYRLDVFPNYTADRYSPHVPYDNLLTLIVNALGLDPKNADVRLAEARARTADIAISLEEQADSYLSALQEAPLPLAKDEAA
jgi:hypothetical protein